MNGVAYLGRPRTYKTYILNVGQGLCNLVCGYGCSVRTGITNDKLTFLMLCDCGKSGGKEPVTVLGSSLQFLNAKMIERANNESSFINESVNLRSYDDYNTDAKETFLQHYGALLDVFSLSHYDTDHYNKYQFIAKNGNRINDDWRIRADKSYKGNLACNDFIKKNTGSDDFNKTNTGYEGTEKEVLFSVSNPDENTYTYEVTKSNTYYSDDEDVEYSDSYCFFVNCNVAKSMDRNWVFTYKVNESIFCISLSEYRTEYTSPFSKKCGVSFIYFINAHNMVRSNMLFKVAEDNTTIVFGDGDTHENFKIPLTLRYNSLFFTLLDNIITSANKTFRCRVYERFMDVLNDEYKADFESLIKKFNESVDSFNTENNSFKEEFIPGVFINMEQESFVSTLKAYLSAVGTTEHRNLTPIEYPSNENVPDGFSRVLVYQVYNPCCNPDGVKLFTHAAVHSNTLVCDQTINVLKDYTDITIHAMTDWQFILSDCRNYIKNANYRLGFFDKGDEKEKNLNSNVVCIYHAPKKKIVFPGDATSHNMFWQVYSGILSDTVLLCAPHHGSDRTSEATYYKTGLPNEGEVKVDVRAQYIAAANPEYHIICSGQERYFGKVKTGIPNQNYFNNSVEFMQYDVEFGHSVCYFNTEASAALARAYIYADVGNKSFFTTYGNYLVGNTISYFTFRLDSDGVFYIYDIVKDDLLNAPVFHDRAFIPPKPALITKPISRPNKPFKFEHNGAPLWK